MTTTNDAVLLVQCNANHNEGLKGLVGDRAGDIACAAIIRACRLGGGGQYTLLTDHRSTDPP